MYSEAHTSSAIKRTDVVSPNVKMELSHGAPTKEATHDAKQANKTTPKGDAPTRSNAHNAVGVKKASDLGHKVRAVYNSAKGTVTDLAHNIKSGVSSMFSAVQEEMKDAEHGEESGEASTDDDFYDDNETENSEVDDTDDDNEHKHH